MRNLQIIMKQDIVFSHAILPFYIRSVTSSMSGTPSAKTKNKKPLNADRRSAQGNQAVGQRRASRLENRGTACVSGGGDGGRLRLSSLWVTVRVLASSEIAFRHNYTMA
jgi:hypothetical protein